MKKIKSTDETYDVIERVLRESEVPLTAPELMEIGPVRAAALARFGEDVQTTTNKLSDTLGFMWRRGILKRFTAPESLVNKARYAYLCADAAPDKIVEVAPPPTLSAKKKAVYNIIECDEGVRIELDRVSIFIRHD